MAAFARAIEGALPGRKPRALAPLDPSAGEAAPTSLPREALAVATPHAPPSRTEPTAHAPAPKAPVAAPSLADRQATVDRSVNHMALRSAVEGSVTSEALGSVRVVAREHDGGVAIAVHTARPEAEQKLRVEQSALVSHVEAAHVKVGDVAITKDDRLASLDRNPAGGGGGQSSSERDRDDAEADVATPNQPSRGRVRFVL